MLTQTNYRIILLILIIFYITIIKAQIVKYSNEFLAIGVSARGLSLGGAIVSNTSDGNSSFWNPAGLTKIPNDAQINLMHNNYFGGIAKYDYGNLTFKLDESNAISASYIRMGIDDIPNTLELIDYNGNINYDKVTSFSAIDNAFIFSYATNMSKLNNLRIGSNFKIIYRKVGDFATAWGFGIDGGIQYSIRKWILGAVIKDITTTFNIWSYDKKQFEDVFLRTGNQISSSYTELTMPSLTIGVSREFKISDRISLLAMNDWRITTDGKRNVLIKTNIISTDPSLGMEVGYKKFAYIRMGINNFQQIRDIDQRKKLHVQPNMGIGINIKNTVMIDYALTNIGDKTIALYSNVFSIKINLTKKHNTEK